jgi:hypothetical protein
MPPGDGRLVGMAADKASSESPYLLPPPRILEQVLGSRSRAIEPDFS